MRRFYLTGRWEAGGLEMWPLATATWDKHCRSTKMERFFQISDTVFFFFNQILPWQHLARLGEIAKMMRKLKAPHCFGCSNPPQDAGKKGDFAGDWGRVLTFFVFVLLFGKKPSTSPKMSNTIDLTWFFSFTSD